MTGEYQTLEEAAKKATPGPWRTGDAWRACVLAGVNHRRDCPDYSVGKPCRETVLRWTDDDKQVCAEDGTNIILDTAGEYNSPRPEDCSFVALANPATVLALIAELREAKSEVAQWKRTTGYEDAETLDFVLGRSGIDTHLNVQIAMLNAARERAESAERALAAMTAERDTAIEMLADWCAAIDRNGTGWDDWDEFYKDARFRPGPLRGLLDVAIASAMEVMRGND